MQPSHQVNPQVNTENIKVTYFPIRGRAEPARLMMHLGNVKFDDERVNFEQFHAQKAQGKFVFGQVPVLEYKGVQYAQSIGITKFAAKKAGFYPTCDLEILRADQALHTFSELEEIYVQWFIEQDQQKKQEKYKDMVNVKAPEYFKKFDDLLKENHTGFFAGSKLSYADFAIYNIVNSFNSGLFFPGTTTVETVNLLDQFSYLKQNINLIESIPEVRQWNLTVNQIQPQQEQKPVEQVQQKQQQQEHHLEKQPSQTLEQQEQQQVAQATTQQQGNNSEKQQQVDPATTN